MPVYYSAASFNYMARGALFDKDDNDGAIEQAESQMSEPGEKGKTKLGGASLMTEKEETCEERIDAELKKTISYMREMWDVYIGEKEPADEITEESFSEYGLSFDYVEPEEDEEKGYFRYQLSWGGPSDEFRFYCDPGFRCYYVEYVFMDWFDGATRRLRDFNRRFLLKIFNDVFVVPGTAGYVFKEATARE